MYVALLLDSDHYTDVEYLFDSDLVKLKEKVKQLIYNEEFDILEEETDAEIVVSSQYGWIKCQTFEIEKYPYYLIWHHAYDGVDFTIRGYKTFDETREVMLKEVEEEEKIESFVYENEATLDNGTEFLHWEVIKHEEH